MVSRKVFEQAITDLSAATNLSVSALAKKLGVSRAWLYENFPEVRDFSQNSLTDDDVIVALEKMRAKRPRDKFTIKEVSEHLGTTRQTFSKKFKHLFKYLAPDTSVFAQSSIEESLLLNVKELERKISELTEEREIALKTKEDEIFSTLMRKDSEEFETIKTSTSMKRLQDQAEEHSRLARNTAKESAELRLEITKLKAKEAQGGCEIISHIKPDYSAISAAKNATTKDIHKMFIEAERRNLDFAEEIIVESQPDFVFLFQPFFSCDRLSIPVLPLSGKVVLVESNIFREDLRNQFVKNLSGFVIFAIHAKTSLAKTKLWARGAKIPLDEDFISKIHEQIMPPLLEDGFSTVICFDPARLMS
tara:strand:- start:1639 stop:2724 length:1086 start_codon:yes stop_codon:yes gene_type:complete